MSVLKKICFITLILLFRINIFRILFSTIKYFSSPSVCTVSGVRLIRRNDFLFCSYSLHSFEPFIQLNTHWINFELNSFYVFFFRSISQIRTKLFNKYLRKNIFNLIYVKYIYKWIFDSNWLTQTVLKIIFWTHNMIALKALFSSRMHSIRMETAIDDYWKIARNTVEYILIKLQPNCTSVHIFIAGHSVEWMVWNPKRSLSEI